MHKRPGVAWPLAEHCPSLVMQERFYVSRRVDVNRLGASEIERSVVRVNVVEADVAEVAVRDS